MAEDKGPASAGGSGGQASKSTTALKEEEVLKFWEENHIFEKSLAKPAPKGEFVFYEGPPTANAKPALHHLEARAFKDALPRYKTMRGFHVRRKAGWDTHGLPVELQIEKELGFTGKPDIEKYGVEAFNEKCRESVKRYIGVWEGFTDRIGYWVDKKDAYYTFDASYMESLWSIVKKVNGDGRLYKDYKVVPWCSRCGTALSSHELAQGYKDVKDLSITAKFELVSEDKTFLLAWTTTPWTLPGNIALAVGPNIDYVKVKVGDERYILAKKLVESVLKDVPHEVVANLKGTDLGGLHYKPLYPYLTQIIAGEEKKKLDTAYKVYHADFVTTEDGTGVVHTAVMYGQDDFELGTKVGLPKVHLVKPDGMFVGGMGFLSDRSVVDETLAVGILKDLQQRGLYFDKQNYVHSYPFCWRCGTRLIYYARDSWYIRMTELRDELVAENQKINWEPAHIRDGRFGEWISGVKDWAISRERYWGTPLPVWTSADGKEQVIIGSVDELKQRVKKSGNTYRVMRHGESDINTSPTWKREVEENAALSEKGKEQIKTSSVQLKNSMPDVVLCSTMLRAKQSAEIFSEVTGFPAADIVHDDRIREWNVDNKFEGQPLDAVDKLYETEYMQNVHADITENFAALVRRVGDFLYDIEKQYAGKKVLIIAHDGTNRALQFVAGGMQLGGLDCSGPLRCIDNGEVTDLNFVPLPHNKDFELDLHKPYIDQVMLLSDSGAELKRTSEVMDVWFDSGAMPFAQDHYPFEGTEIAYPADFISEAIDQTRGWFYTLHAVGVLMGKGRAYKNVICLGHLLDEKGLKMSKSKGNIVDPFVALDEHGADLLRYWMYSVNAPGDGKSFDPKVLAEMKNKVFNSLQNALQFYELYKIDRVPQKGDSEHVLDRWILSRMNRALTEMTQGFEVYDMLKAARQVRSFAEDFSTWYIRRSRDRVKGDDEKDKQDALNTMHLVFFDMSKAMAPLTPFFAETIHQSIRTADDPESVHLAGWPEPWAFDDQLEADMEEVRRVVSLALEARQSAGIKIRQPLATLTAVSPTLAGKEELLALIRDEINVKSVVLAESGQAVQLDTTITDDLKEEGELRDLIREVQDLRKQAGLNPKDQAVLTIPRDRKAFVEKHWVALSKAAGLASVVEGNLYVTKA